MLHTGMEGNAWVFTGKAESHATEYSNRHMQHAGR